MASFLYFHPGGPAAITPKHVTKIGLDYALDGAQLEGRRVNNNSPSGKPGLLFADSARQGGKAVGYYADQQTWRQMPSIGGRPELWVGYWNDAKPTPGELQRPQMLRGPLITFADGNQWQIPIVRHYDVDHYQSALPAYLDYDDSGKVVKGNPLEKYNELWELTTPIAEAHISDAECTDDQLYTAIFALLGANYTVGMAEIIALQILADDESLALAALASCRYDKLLEWLQKKTDSPSTENGSDSSAGDAA
jgi:hypothetical protein